MKAIRVHEFGAPEVMLLEDVLELKPGPKQVLVRVKAVGVNPVDTYVRTGTYAIKPPLPYTPGIDAAGIVESAGQDVKSVVVGARVYTSGTISGAYAEQALCEESQVHPLPQNISFPQGAAINTPYATAYRALFQRAHAVPYETVLVHGASGGVGTAAVQLARAAGMRVIGTAGTLKGMALVTKEGAHHVLDHKSPNHLDLDQALTLTGGQGADVILEMLANVNLGKDLKALARGGRLVVVGSRGKAEIDPRDTMRREAAILGVLLLNATEREKRSAHAALRSGLENGALRPVVGKEMALANAPRAHHAVIEESAYGKIVLVP